MLNRQSGYLGLCFQTTGILYHTFVVMALIITISRRISAKRVNEANRKRFKTIQLFFPFLVNGWSF